MQVGVKETTLRLADLLKGLIPTAESAGQQILQLSLAALLRAGAKGPLPRPHRKPARSPTNLPSSPSRALQFPPSQPSQRRGEPRTAAPLLRRPSHARRPLPE